jgi:CRP/FNR family cyclic AMP-dependent transcriptional regulator
MQLQPFNDVSRTLIDEINTYGRLRTFKKGESCMQGDDTLKHFYLILKGRMKVFDINFETGREQTWYLLTRGDMFDVVTLLDAKEHDVMTEALDDLSVIELPMNKAREWLQTNPAFNQLLLPYLAAQIRSLESLSASLSLYDTSERLMRLIIDNLDPKTQQPTLLNNLSNSEIAKMIGSVRQVVERNLKQLKNDDIIESGRKQLRVKNLDRLRHRLTKLLP